MKDSITQDLRTIKEDTVLALQAIRYDFQSLKDDIKLGLNRDAAEFAEKARLGFPLDILKNM